MRLIVITLILVLSGTMNSQNFKLNKLTEAEKQVILKKGTERPYTGEYYNKNEKGVYVCKQCNAPLYNSSDKFDSHCGWPSFDDEIQGAVKRIPDPDGFRTEIVCNRCGGHLGHVFLGEGFTTKNTRHCVNSISLKFIPEKEMTEKAYFAAGCFWGVEYYLNKAKGVIGTTSGYSGGTTENPTYKQVCTGLTGHAETVEVEYNSEETDFETLCKLFFEIHDPTQIDRQGPDKGEQYRSVVFYTNEKQKEITVKLITELESKGLKVATEVIPFKKFWAAEDYHQDYYDGNGKLPYCHGYTKRF